MLLLEVQTGTGAVVRPLLTRRLTCAVIAATARCFYGTAKHNKLRGVLLCGSTLKSDACPSRLNENNLNRQGSKSIPSEDKVTPHFRAVLKAANKRRTNESFKKLLLWSVATCMLVDY
jgi:hypothetical protein